MAKGCTKTSTKKTAYYKGRFGRTDDNKKRTLGRHIRHFPEDKQAIKIYENTRSYGDATGHESNMTARARRRTNPKTIRNRERVKKLVSRT